MATLRFHLRDAAASGPTPLVLYFSHNSKVAKIPTGQSILPVHWDAAGQKARRAYVGAPELNHFLKSFALQVEAAYTRLKSELGHEPSAAHVREVVVAERAPKRDAQADFLGAYEQFMLIKQIEKSELTLKKYKGLLQHLHDFAAHRRFKLTFAGLDQRFYELFTAYLIQQKGHTNNTVGKYISTLKTFLRWAADRGLNEQVAFNKFKVPNEKSDIIYLTEAELMALCALDLSGNATLAKVRDAFCFGCFTGQRFSDLAAIRSTDIRNGTWYLHQLKGRKTVQVEVPLSEFALEILERYKDSSKPLPMMTNQRMNLYLKELGALAGINEPIKQVRYRGAERLEVTEPKFRFLTTHTARRTFVTLSLEKGMRPEVAMEITGHQSYNIFKKYIVLTSKAKKAEMAAVWKKSSQ